MPNPFHIGKSDLLRSKTVKPGWYETLVKSVTDVSAKSSGVAGKSIELIIVGSDFADVPLTARFWENAPGFAANFIWAITGKKVEDSGYFQLENAVGKKIKTFVKNKEWQGRVGNEASDFMPLNV
jgi:hypothetical protein